MRTILTVYITDLVEFMDWCNPVNPSIFLPFSYVRCGVCSTAAMLICFDETLDSMDPNDFGGGEIFIAGNFLFFFILHIFVLLLS